jgi:signal transduction histidine kinase
VRLLQNLLANALKYRSPESKPEIIVSSRLERPDWVIMISDNGVGIPGDQLERIFIIFQRLHGKDVEGGGIGLASCKRIVEHHGGRIWAESEFGQGSKFSFTLPERSAAAFARGCDFRL